MAVLQPRLGGAYAAYRDQTRLFVELRWIELRIDTSSDEPMRLSSPHSMLCRWLLIAAPIITSATYGSSAFAEPGHPRDPAAAQALFYEARTLMKSGDYANACSKLEESLRLDYGVGTEFNLSDCREKVGKLASAWSGFMNVAAAAKSQGQTEREKVALERAKTLEPRLPKLVIEVQGPALPGYEVKRDGVTVGPASWGVAIPVDPGVHRVTVSATSAVPWEGTVTAYEGKRARIAVPRQLASAAVPVAEAVPAPAPVAAPAPAIASFPDPVVEPRGKTQRGIGYVAGSIGLVGLGIGAGFAFDSLQQRDRATKYCTGDACDPTGVAIRQRAMQSGDAATIAGVAGGAALLGGILLVLTAPSGPERKETASTSFRAVPRVAHNSAGISLEGVLP